MRDQATPLTLRPTNAGVLYLHGYGTSITVESSMLQIRSVVGGRIAEGRFARVERPRLRRLIVHGKGGWVSFEALSWLKGMGAEFALLASDGQVLASSGSLGLDRPDLRRLQATAMDTPVGLEVARFLIREKVTGQLHNLRQMLPTREGASEVARELDAIEAAPDAGTLILAESRAALAFWNQVTDRPMRFARADQPRVPTHWRTVGTRASALTGQPRKATTAAHGIWNYCYRLAEIETRLACLGAGLDPGIGVVHVDQRSRENMVLDLIEAVRPLVDRYVLKLLAERTFTRREFVELPNGNVRLTPGLARSLADTLPLWQRAIAPVAEQVAWMLAGKSPRRQGLPTRLTEDNRSRGRDRLRSGARKKPAPKAPQWPNACRTCGLLLPRSKRRYCDECLPEHKSESMSKGVAAGAARLAELRAGGRDPAHGGEAGRKKARALARHRAEAREWESANGPAPGPAIFTAEILPGLAEVPVRQMAKATGLSRQYCGLVKRGVYIPHVRHWENLQALSRRGAAVSRQPPGE